MNIYGLDIDLDSHEFNECSLNFLKEYRDKGWRVVGFINHNYGALYILVRKIEPNNPYR